MQTFTAESEAWSGRCSFFSPSSFMLNSTPTFLAFNSVSCEKKNVLNIDRLNLKPMKREKEATENQRNFWTCLVRVSSSERYCSCAENRSRISTKSSTNDTALRLKLCFFSFKSLTTVKNRVKVTIEVVSRILSTWTTNSQSNVEPCLLNSEVILRQIVSCNYKITFSLWSVTSLPHLNMISW